MVQETTSYGMRLDQRVDLGAAYASSSANVAVFRESAIVSVGTENIVAYYDDAGYVRVVRLSQDGMTEGELRVLPRLSDARLGDGHDVISLGLSPDGLVHAMYGAHVTSPFYVSFSPGQVTGIAGATTVTASPWPETLTYPQFYTYGNALHLWYRCGADICDQAYGQISHAWTKPRDLLSAGTGQTVYMNRLAVDGTTLTLSWVYRIPPPPQTADVLNDGTYVMSSTDSGETWHDLHGVRLSLPVPPASVPRMVSVPVGDGLINQSSAVMVNQTYFLVDLHQDALGRPQIFLSILDMQTGVSCTQTVSSNETPADLVGNGTLTLPVSRAEVAVSNRAIHVMYRQDNSMVIASAPRDGSTCPSDWQYQTPATDALGSWEPTYDHDEWSRLGRLVMYVQSTRQGPNDTAAAGSPTPASVYELTEAH